MKQLLHTAIFAYREEEGQQEGHQLLVTSSNNKNP